MGQGTGLKLNIWQVFKAFLDAGKTEHLGPLLPSVRRSSLHHEQKGILMRKLELLIKCCMNIELVLIQASDIFRKAGPNLIYKYGFIAFPSFNALEHKME